MAKRKVLDLTSLTDHAQHLSDAVNGEPDLPCALMCGAFIEQYLAALLNSVLIQGDTTAKLFKDGGLLGSAAARSKMAYSLGLIDKPMFQNINTIGEIRNLFAHSHAPVTFADKEVADLCNDLTFPQQVNVVCYGENVGIDTVWDMFGPRKRFSFIATATTSTLHQIAEQMDRGTRLVTPWSPKE